MSLETLELEKEIIKITGHPLVGYDSPLTSSRLESYIGKVWRHIKSIEIDPGTLRSGIKQLRYNLKLLSPCLINGSDYFDDPNIIENYLGIQGLIMADYLYNSHNHPHETNSSMRLYDFPLCAKFAVCVTPPNDMYIESSKFASKAMADSPDVIAYFTGPTHQVGVGLPNNGFYLKGYPEGVPFMDTNPSGQRRGAFAASEGGGLVIVDDKTKWKLIRNEFCGVKTLIGGAMFLTDRDKELNVNQLRYGSISYLFQYRDQDGQLHTGFASARNYCPRLGIQRLLADYTKRMGAVSFVGLEMEYNDSGCFIRGEDKKAIKQIGYQTRFDHYLVTL